MEEEKEAENWSTRGITVEKLFKRKDRVVVECLSKYIIQMLLAPTPILLASLGGARLRNDDHATIRKETAEIKLLFP